MRRKFATITAMAKADQRRHSRRFHSEMVESAWTATAVTATELDSSMMDGDSGTHAEYVIRTNFAALYRELAETVEGARASTTNRASPSGTATSSSCSSSSSSSTVTMASVASRQPTHHHHPNHCVNGGSGGGGGGGGGGHLHLHNHHHRHPHHPHHHNHHSHHLASSSTASASSPAYHYQLVQQLSESQSQYPFHQHHNGTATPPPSIAGFGAGAAAAGTASSSYASCASSSLSSSSCSPAVIAAAAASTAQLLGGGNNPIASPVSHVLYNDHNHNGSHSHGELRRSDSKSSSSSGASGNAASNCSKRVPPEVPRRTSSSLSNGKSPLLTSAFSQDSPHPRQRSQTPCGLTQNSTAYPGLLMVDTDQHQNRTARARNGGGNLMTEHSTSEDSLENVVYSNSYWCEANAGGVAGGSNGGGSSNNNINNLSTPQNHSSSHVHSSPVPFPPSQHDRLILNGSGPGTPIASGSPAPPVTAAVTGSGLTPLNAFTASQPTSAQAKVLESIRKRQYRVGLNLFNKKPERGVAYLTQKGFLDASPRAVAKFFITRKGVSKQMIGEYLGNLQNPFNMATLDFFIEELDFAGLEIDVALRRFQTYFRMPGEAQKIERLMEVFGQRYCQCNPQLAARLRNPDTVFILAFAIIMLNTDLHTPSIKGMSSCLYFFFFSNIPFLVIPTSHSIRHVISATAAAADCHHFFFGND